MVVSKIGCISKSKYHSSLRISVCIELYNSIEQLFILFPKQMSAWSVQGTQGAFGFLGAALMVCQSKRQRN